MSRILEMFSMLLMIGLILFNHQIITKSQAAEFVEELDEEIIITTANTELENEASKTPQTPTSEIETDTTTISEDTAVIDNSEVPVDDVIELNVGGQRLATFRSTLTAVPNSKLALMFTKKADNQKKSGNTDKISYFLDYNPTQFSYMLDQLREIKRLKNFSPFEINIRSPIVDVGFNFSIMLRELGLVPERFLSPLLGVHLNLKVDSLQGWKECYRNTYNYRFNTTVLTDRCKGKRLLVACRSVKNKSTLTLAGITDRQYIFNQCPQFNYCMTNKVNGVGFYYVTDNVWGFDARPKESSTSTQFGYFGSTALLNPCDTSDHYSEYRLCWSMPLGYQRGAGDRCGTEKYLQNSKDWERIIYEAV